MNVEKMAEYNLWGEYLNFSNVLFSKRYNLDVKTVRIFNDEEIAVTRTTMPADFEFINSSPNLSANLVVSGKPPSATTECVSIMPTQLAANSHTTTKSVSLPEMSSSLIMTSLEEDCIACSTQSKPSFNMDITTQCLDVIPPLANHISLSMCDGVMESWNDEVTVPLFNEVKDRLFVNVKTRLFDNVTMNINCNTDRELNQDDVTDESAKVEFDPAKMELVPVTSRETSSLQSNTTALLFAYGYCTFIIIFCFV